MRSLVIPGERREALGKGIQEHDRQDMDPFPFPFGGSPPPAGDDTEK
jgi:hypothetical protein